MFVCILFLLPNKNIILNVYKNVNKKFIKILGTITMNYLKLKKQIDTSLNRDVRLAEIARALETSAQNFNKKYKNTNTQVTIDDLQRAEKYFNIKLIDSSDCITIEHIHINPSCGKGAIVLDEAEVTPVKIGREIIKNLWNSKPENLKIFTASGDSMADTIEDGNLLLIDISKTEYRNGGIFLLTINNDWYIKRLRMRLTGELDIISDNPKYPMETLKPDTDIEINIKGRVIKNLSRGL